MTFELPPLAYAFNAMEPYIDSTTMQLHHDKHHLTYVTKLNDALPDKSVNDIVSVCLEASKAPKVIRNNGNLHRHIYYCVFGVPFCRWRPLQSFTVLEVDGTGGNIACCSK